MEETFGPKTRLHLDIYQGALGNERHNDPHHREQRVNQLTRAQTLYVGVALVENTGTKGKGPDAQAKDER